MIHRYIGIRHTDHGNPVCKKLVQTVINVCCINRSQRDTSNINNTVIVLISHHHLLLLLQLAWWRKSDWWLHERRKSPHNSLSMIATVQRRIFLLLLCGVDSFPRHSIKSLKLLLCLVVYCHHQHKQQTSYYQWLPAEGFSPPTRKPTTQRDLVRFHWHRHDHRHRTFSN